MAVTYNRSDLEFILEQILMAEADQPPVSPHLAFGLREVAGTANNSIPGNELFGAADQGFPAVTDPLFQTVTFNADGTIFDPNPGIAGDLITTSYISTSGAVYDTAPRTISNLIADQTAANPAAVAAQQVALEDLGIGYQSANNPATPANVFSDGSLFISNITPDAGLSAPFNSWFTFFGQFFDHGVDLITKGGNGTVFIPLAAGDPLYSTAPGANNFMVLTRATDVTVGPGADGILGTSDDVHTHQNTLTPFVDQSQTYSSHPSHQVFLREYGTLPNGVPYQTGRLLESTAADGSKHMATWANVKANALKIGIVLNDTTDVVNIPLVKVDAYGNFIPDANGLAQLVTGAGADGIAGTADDVTISGTISAAGVITPITTAGAMRIGVAFLNDMNAAADPVNHFGPGFLTADADSAVGTTRVLNPNYNANFIGTKTFLLETTQYVVANPNFVGAPGSGTAVNPEYLLPGAVYDNELLDAHYIAGDGRVNENIGLTAVHEIFHSEHNRLVEQTKALIRAQLAAGDNSFAAQWVVAGANLADGIQDNEWNGERLFQAAKFGTETQYQHLVFEEFARKVAPTIHLFGNNNIHLDPLITSEFANVVYRFGHSMLDENVNRYVIHQGSPGDPLNGTPEMHKAYIDGMGNESDTGGMGYTANALAGTPVMNNIGLIQAFTNPLEYLNHGANAAGQIILGSVNQVGNEIDEFVTGALRNNLLGLPLDLAALNIARGRDVGVAGLNVVRNQLYNQAPSAASDNPAYHDTNLKPYASWSEFGQFLKHAASLVNFIAAYGTHHTITDATTLIDKRTAALTLIENSVIGGASFDQDAYDFIHSTGQYANDPTHTNPLTVHTEWSTGSITGLDNVDLWIGGLAEKQTLFGGLLGTTFNYIFETQLEALQDGDRLYYLPRIEGMHFASEIEGNSFAELIQANTGIKHLSASIFLTPEYVVEAGTVTNDPSTWLRNKVTGALLVEKLADGTVHFIGDDNFLGNTMVLGGTEGNDRLVAGHADDDTVWGDGGNDFIDGGNGDDFLYGGTGNDTISDSSGNDIIHGDAGDDTIYAGIGDDVVFGGDGNDYIEGGHGIDDVVGGVGNDIILGGEDDDEMQGNEGDDWMEGGTGGDILVGDVGAPTGQVPLYAGNDVLDGGAEGDKMQGFSGDDIMLGEGGFDKFLGYLGFDWGSYEKETHGVDVNQNAREFIPGTGQPAGDAVRDFWTQTEGLSGSAFNDDLKGEAGGKVDPLNELNNTQLIRGLQDGWNGARNFFAPGTDVHYSQGNIILGGGGSDRITGDSMKLVGGAQVPPTGGGNDIIDGDAFLHVALLQGYQAGSEIWREIKFAPAAANDLDISVYNDVIANYLISDDSNGDGIIDSNDRQLNASSISNTVLTADAQGFVSIFHNVAANGGGGGGGGGGAAATLTDGTDLLRNIERLEFSDQSIELNIGANRAGTIAKDVATNAAGLANRLPTVAGGALVLSDITGAIATPAAGDLLSFNNALAADFGIADADGIAGPVHLQWQVQTVAHPGWLNVAGATSATWVPSDFFVGSTFRLEATFTDGRGVHETIDSAESAILGPNTTINHAPTIVQQTSPPGLQDTTGIEDVAISELRLPLDAVFADDVTPLTPGAMVFTATLSGTLNGVNVDGIVLNAPGGAANVSGLFFDTATTNAAGNQVGRISTAAGVGPGGANFAGPINVRITATDQGGLSVQDTFTINVLPQNDGKAAFSIAGTKTEDPKTEGQTLTVSQLAADPDGGPASGYDYQWLRDGFTITGATASTYTLSDTDGGHAITARAVYTDAQGFFETVDTSAGAIAIADNGQASLSVVGVSSPVLVEGQQIRAVLGADPDNGIAAGTAILTWLRNGTAIGAPVAITAANAAHLVYTLTAADAGGAVISARVTYTDGQGFAGTVTAVAAPVAFVNDGAATWGITGQAEVGATLTASLVTADPDEGQNGFAAFQWQSSSNSGASWSDISGATGLSYKLDAADVNKIIRVNVSYTDNEDFAESVFSAATLSVVRVNSAPVFGAFGGTSVTENTLGAVTGSATDVDGDPLTVTLAGPDAAFFNLTGAAGAFTLAFNTAPDFEAPVHPNNTFTFDVLASDGTATTTRTVSINVTNALGATFTSTAAVNNFAGAGEEDTFNYLATGGADVFNGAGGIDTLNIAVAAGAAQTLTAAFDGLKLTSFNLGAGTGSVALSNIEVVNANLGDLTDTLAYTAAAGVNVSVNLATGAASGFTSIAGIENVTGGNGGNNLTGDANANILTGGNGVDILAGGRGNDTVSGGAGADIINYTVGDGADGITGGAGNDTLNIVGTSAGDTLTVTLVGAAITNFDDGSGLSTVATVEVVNVDLGTGAANTLSYGTTAAAVTVNLATGLNPGVASLLNVANITGGGAGDTLTGNASANVISGGAGGDTITGGLGNDSLFGDAGGDTFNFTFGDGADAYDGGAGVDTLNINGTASNDTLTVLSNGAAILTFNDGTSTSTVVAVETITAALGAGTGDTLNYGATTAGVTVNLVTGAASGFSSITGIENVTGGSGGDTLSGGAGINVLSGGAGIDTLSGGAGADILNGDAGNDIFNYTIGDGADVIDGGADSDTLNILGTGGADTLAVALEATGIITIATLTYSNMEFITANGGTGVDTLNYTNPASGTSAGLSVNLATGAASGFSSITGFENVSGAGGNDTITGDGNANSLAGGNGADILDGGVGNDVLSGGAGNDTLIGGAGVDNLTGGAGSDTFKFLAIGDSTAAIRDTITDFTAHSGATINDLIDLSAIDANTTVAGIQAFGFVANGGLFTNATVGQVHVITNGGGSFLVEGHTAGHTTIDFQIALTSAATLVTGMTALDFKLS